MQSEKRKLKYKIYTRKEKKKTSITPRTLKKTSQLQIIVPLYLLWRTSKSGTGKKLVSPRRCFVNEAAILRHDRSVDHDERIYFRRLHRLSNDHNLVHLYCYNIFCSSLTRISSGGHNYYHFFSCHQAMKKMGSRNICCLF